MKKKRINPAHLPKIDTKAWILAAQCYKKSTPHSEMMALAREQATTEENPLFISHVENYRRDLGYVQLDRVSRLKTKITERLPIRQTWRDVPFYLRPTYVVERGCYVGNTHIPQRNYSDLCKPAPKYAPIQNLTAKLHRKRCSILRENMDGLIRWPDTISVDKSEFIVTPTFNNFYFKINTGDTPNKLPVVKRYGALALTVHAPLEFFNQTFWGLGEHLVVRVISKYTTDDGIAVTKTLSCDRENLYDLKEPTLLKERYYVNKEGQWGTGLTETAAIRSMSYFLGKHISSLLMA